MPALWVKLGANDLNCVDVPLNPTQSPTLWVYAGVNVTGGGDCFCFSCHPVYGTKKSVLDVALALAFSDFGLSPVTNGFRHHDAGRSKHRRA